MSTPRVKLRVIRAVALSASLLVLTAVSIPPAQVARAADPDAPTASDGSSVPVREWSATLRGENPNEGSGGQEATPEDPAQDNADYRRLRTLRPATAKVGQETIIGADNRVLVNPTTSFPARAAVLITFTGGRCSGWLYGKDIVGTAGHCVHTGGSGGTWRTNVRVYPGYNGAAVTKAPYGSCTAKRLHSVTGWTSSGDEAYDYGAIKLNCTVGNTTGWFGYFWQSASLTGQPSVINGYPGDKPLTQWRSTDLIRVTQALQLFYFNDTVGGMSGSAVYSNRPAGSPFCVGNCVMAVHAYGLHGAAPHSTHNHGERITESRFNNLKSWKDAV